MSILKDNDPASKASRTKSCSIEAPSVERKRSERTAAHFLLVLIDFGRLARAQLGGTLEKIGTALAVSTRETDITGWHRDKIALGVIFTALNGTSRE